MNKKERYQRVLDYFLHQRPVAETELEYTNPYELLVAVILSAQCTDKRVNLTTPELFSRFPDPASLAAVEPEEIYPYIKSISYPNNKARHLSGMAKTLLEKFSGKVPSTVEELQQLPGVGRKTANVIASVVYNLPAMAVDTHVFRVSARLGLTTAARNPLQAEKQLVANIPEDLIPLAHHWLILHGRYVCTARSPKCDRCGLRTICKFFASKKKLPSRIKKKNLGK